MNASSGVMGGMQQQPTPSSYQPAFGQQQMQQGYAQPQGGQPVEEDPTEKLLKMKKLLDAGAITQEEYDAVKAKVLGL